MRVHHVRIVYVLRVGEQEERRSPGDGGNVSVT